MERTPKEEAVEKRWSAWRTIKREKGRKSRTRGRRLVNVATATCGPFERVPRTLHASTTRTAYYNRRDLTFVSELKAKRELLSFGAAKRTSHEREVLGHPNDVHSLLSHHTAHQNSNTSGQFRLLRRRRDAHEAFEHRIGPVGLQLLPNDMASLFKNAH